MKVPKHVIDEARKRMWLLVDSGYTLERQFQIQMSLLKQIYAAQKQKAVEYGFINQSGKVAYAIPCICRMQSISSACGVKEHVLPESVALRNVAGWVLRAFRNRKGLGG